MNILVLNGNQYDGNANFDAYMEQLCGRLAEKGHSVSAFRLREKDIRYCTGCWSCWWTTPGECMHKDWMGECYAAVNRSRLLVLASPLRLGMVTPVMKKLMERMIPLLLPFITLYKGESHHELRYGKMPGLGVVVGQEPDGTDEDIGIIRDLFYRYNLNFRFRRFAFRTDHDPVEEVTGEFTRY